MVKRCPKLATTEVLICKKKFALFTKKHVILENPNNNSIQ